MARDLHQNKDATIYVGSLNEHVDEEILTELFIQAGPVVRVNIPRDKLSNRHNGFGFVEFRTEDDARYATELMQGIRLFGNPIQIGTAASVPPDQIDVGAKLYVGNLAPDVSDSVLHQMFSRFGIIHTCRVVIDKVSGKSLGHGFVSYDSFESADQALKNMNGQFLCNQMITVTYAYKDDSKSGEKHGDKTERMIAPTARAKAAAKIFSSHITPT